MSNYLQQQVVVFNIDDIIDEKCKILVIAGITTMISVIWFKVFNYILQRKNERANREHQSTGWLYPIIIQFGIKLVRIIFFYYLAHILNLQSMTDHIVLALFIWVFLEIPLKLSGLAWEMKSWKYFLVIILELLVSAILTAQIWVLYEDIKNQDSLWDIVKLFFPLNFGAGVQQALQDGEQILRDFQEKTQEYVEKVEENLQDFQEKVQEKAQNIKDSADL
ncbi:hypothetical protein PPERSA_08974 [Pseudocohnilembus persalinus]|uniref:Transmembrane protein n=1 Tax=Pseudocohnilembus persalinus TaxID=266149 RepID=A0A0V0R2Y4_PSEPJ|nr:hypothetical protein PPERSA_08974 [Pseudocohnilembus persalinus]|eukprot:KRX08870.1 hypothetical protein PPERSA_08974 [Pseudocohnilembus persalinus]